MSQTTTGLIGEYIAAGVVLSLGWRVSMCQQDKVDLVAWKEDEYIRIQVRILRQWESAFLYYTS